MNDYLDKPTLEERLAAYLSSEEFGQDMYLKALEYADANTPVPPAEQLRSQVIADKVAWLETYDKCETEGHAWKETADPENGTSDFHCVRCGERRLLHW